MKSISTKLFLTTVALIWLVVLVGDTLSMFIFERRDMTFRAWETVISGKQFPPFLPNYIFENRIYGDLANFAKISELRRFRSQRFCTDARGFRNPAFENGTRLPLVAIGDSDMAGSSLSDNETYTSQLGQMLGVPVYNYSPMSPIIFLGDDRFRKNPPEILIWEAVERTINDRAYQVYTTIPVQSNIFIPDEYREKKRIPEARPRLLTGWCQWAFHTVRWRLTGLHNPQIGYIDTNNGMLFYKKGIDLLNQTADERGLATVVDGIVRIHEICRRRGITLVYMPLPDKENIYQQWLPPILRGYNNQKPFVSELVSALNARGVTTVSLYEPFLSAAKNKKLLYFEDDSHWNSDGVELAAQTTMHRLRQRCIGGKQ